MKKAGFITVHGMGDTEVDYAEELNTKVRAALGAQAAKLHVGSVYYQDLLQNNEERVWQAMAYRLRWDKLRKFMLFGFADAAGLEHRKELEDSSYHHAQLKIARTLWQASQQIGADGKLLVLAQSLGCHILSCYLWDAGRALAGFRPTAGIWRNIRRYQYDITDGAELTNDEITFLAGRTLNTLMTTGCNIPIFVAAHAQQRIIPFTKPNADFAWLNYYDKDDVLGWPLADLSPEYAAIVTDISVNAYSGVLGWLAASWNPWSHNHYWRDKEVITPLVQRLKALL